MNIRAFTTGVAVCICCGASLPALGTADEHHAADDVVTSIADAGSAAARAAGIERLQEWPAAEVVPVLIRYLARHEAPAGWAVVGHILQHWPHTPVAVVGAAVPQLDDEDPAIRAAARTLLTHFEDRSASRPPDYSSYRALIETAVRRGDEPSDALLAVMLAGDPGTALQTMVRGYQLRDPATIRELLWAEHVVADWLWQRRHGFVASTATSPAVSAELDGLTRSPFPWARAYAAEWLRRDPTLRTPATWARVQADPAPLVVRVLAATTPAR